MRELLLLLSSASGVLVEQSCSLAVVAWVRFLERCAVDIADISSLTAIALGLSGHAAGDL